MKHDSIITSDYYVIVRREETLPAKMILGPPPTPTENSSTHVPRRATGVTLPLFYLPWRRVGTKVDNYEGYPTLVLRPCSILGTSEHQQQEGSSMWSYNKLDRHSSIQSLRKGVVLLNNLQGNFNGNIFFMFWKMFSPCCSKRENIKLCYWDLIFLFCNFRPLS